MQIITTSPNIATLDSQIFADLCAGNFLVDLSPSVWIATGDQNVLGAKVKLTNPYGVVVKDYADSYDVTPSFSGGMDAIVSIAVPTQAGNYQFGKYTISVQLTDADGTTYEVVKTVSICAPNLDKSKKYGTLSVKLTGVCNEGKVYILVDEVPNYKGFSVESTSQSFSLDYPTGSGKPTLTTTQGSFSVQLYEGVYAISGNVCATYNYGDNVYAKVNYQINYSKSITCRLDESCVFTGLAALYEKLNSDCSEEEKRDTENRIERTSILKYVIDTGISAGEDVSDYINDLEDVLGQTCSCSFNNGTPIINNNPSGDVLIQGCNVSKEVVGLTTTYTIDNYSYNVIVPSNGGIFTVSNVVLNGCVQSQTLTFNIQNAYLQIKQLANVNLPEAQYWAGIVMKSLTSIDASCLGISSGQLNALTLSGFVQAIINKACSGVGCTSTVDSITASPDGGDVIIGWGQTNAFSLDVYVDNVLLATVLSASSSYRLVGYADGVTHSYSVVSKCSNGVFGTSLHSTFGFAGCASISAPTVNDTASSNASCPFDLTGIVGSLPAGIQAEWHSANNHLASSLVANPQSVNDGIYYVFATDGNNCYSVGVKVIVTCAVTSSCSAPQNLSVASIIGGLKISFQTALYPPPSNSYLVRRKPAASADVDASYVNIGTPTFNASTNRWEIVDTSAANNTYYTYKATSNCNVPQSVTVNYANITCPTLSVTPSLDSIAYSFATVGGQIDSYKVELWDISGANLIHTDTYTTFGTLTGSFNYLDAGTGYKVRVVPYIGATAFPCAFVTTYTSEGLTANASRSGTFNGFLSAFVAGGVPPYTYAWSYTTEGGSCEAATIDAPTASYTAYTATAYDSVSYTFHLTVTDSVGTTATADTTATGACLVPDTLITMLDGHRIKLSDVEVGDRLKDIDFDTKEEIETIVTSKKYHTVKKLYSINGTLLQTSEGHINIIDVDNDYDLKQSMQLVRGEKLPQQNLVPIEIESVKVEEGQFEVINISTTTKQYIANGIITHNKLACPET